MMPKVTLTGSADGFVKIYYAFFAIIALVAIYFLGRKIGRTAQKAQTKVTVKTGRLTFDLAQYNNYADTLQNAMYGIGYTDFSTINRVMAQMNNDDDVKQLILAFGKRRQDTDVFGSYLSKWFADELSPSQLTELNYALSKKGITVTF